MSSPSAPPKPVSWSGDVGSHAPTAKKRRMNTGPDVDPIYHANARRLETLPPPATPTMAVTRPGSKPAGPVIVISDSDDDDDNDSRDGEDHGDIEEENGAPNDRPRDLPDRGQDHEPKQQHIPQPNDGQNDVPLDHLGRPLSLAALTVARKYWDCQRLVDLHTFEERDARSTPIDPLIRMARHRRTYTMLVLGAQEFQKNSRTYEPPYVEAQKIVPPSLDLPPEEVESGAQVALAAPRKEPALCPEQAEIVELAASRRNIFYTGSAGCGKSTVLHAIRRRLREMGLRVEVLAPTGQVALAINGKTTWVFAGWSPGHHKRKLYDLKSMARGNKNIRKRFRDTDVIIIDEISMIENLHFERLNEALKSARYMEGQALATGVDARHLPFGGVQVIVTGDFCQLPPVKPFEHCIDCGSDLKAQSVGGETIHTCPTCPRRYNDTEKWAFRSKAWEECEFAHVHLKTIHRQRDAGFISMLQKCRLGTPFTPDEVDLLMNHHSITTNAIKLFSTRDEVRLTNEAAFARLKSQPLSYQCFDVFEWRREDHPHLERKGEKLPDGSLRELRDHRFDRRIELKAGMLVVLLVNLDLRSGLCNGSQGIVAGFDPYDEAKLPSAAAKGDVRGEGVLVGEYAALKQGHIKRFAQKQSKNLGWPVVFFLASKERRVIYPECQVSELGDGEPYSLLCRTQVPLAAAWALSIHKSQGMTLDCVIVNLSRAWEEGQVYVALSRATSLEGLKVEGNPNGLMAGMGGNEQVRAFLRDKFGL